ncbi:MAG: MerR family transcriptional regulator [Sarcina ventriculi]|nr:MerR family transcriptional regulator [Sarcina ventriculi]
MNITQVSKKYNVSTDTLRYYERIGLIPPVTRDKHGYRDYTDYDCKWVYFAKVMRGAGVSIESMIEYVSLFMEGENTKDARKQILLDQQDELERKIKEMQETLGYLKHKIDVYEERILKYEEQLIPENKQKNKD